MIDPKNTPIYFEIEEIKNYLSQIKSKKQKIDYLVFLRDELVKICYHFSDYEIDSYLTKQNITIRFDKLEYQRGGDIDQSHISRSEHIQFLRHIDLNILPYVRSTLLTIDSTIKEDESLIIKDYKIFNFDGNKILKYSNELGRAKISYLELIIKNYYSEYIKKYKSTINSNRGNIDPPGSILFEIERSTFVQSIKTRIKQLKRNPDVIYLNSFSDFQNNLKEIKRKKYFEFEPLVFRFIFEDIKNHLKSIDNILDKLIYMEYVKKEVMQNKDLFDTDKTAADDKTNYTLTKITNSIHRKDISEYENDFDTLLNKINIEIKFLEKNKKISNSNSENKSDSDIKIPVLLKMKWLKDNVLLHYLFKVLKDEGFISESDYTNRHKFFEQSFLKKNGKPFTHRESVQAENNYMSNTLNNRKPRNSFMVDKVVEKIKKRR